MKPTTKTRRSTPKPAGFCFESDWDLRPTWTYLAAVIAGSLAPIATAVLLRRATSWTVVESAAAVAGATLAASVAMKLALHARFTILAGGLVLAASVLLPALLVPAGAVPARALVCGSGGLGCGLFFLGTMPPGRSLGYALAVAASMGVAAALAFVIG